MRRPRLLDLFCGAGGCSTGYHRAGFDVVGVDIKPQPRYPFEFVQDDALAYLGYRLGDLGISLCDHFDAIHASPPCQAFTKARKLQGNEHADLVGPTRELLEQTGLPYVIENVKGAPLRNPVMLEGQMFDGLNVHRPRLFETNWPLEVPTLRPPPPRQTKMGRPPVPGEAMQIVGHFSDVPAGREAMGIDWMTQGELAQAIPPAYCELIGSQLLAYLRASGRVLSDSSPEHTSGTFASPGRKTGSRPNTDGPEGNVSSEHSRRTESSVTGACSPESRQVLDALD